MNLNTWTRSNKVRIDQLIEEEDDKTRVFVQVRALTGKSRGGIGEINANYLYESTHGEEYYNVGGLPGERAARNLEVIGLYKKRYEKLEHRQCCDLCGQPVKE